MSHQSDDAACTTTHWKRTSGITFGALAAVGVAIVAGPLRRRLRETLPLLCLRGRGTAPGDDTLTEEVRQRIDSVTAELNLPAFQVSVADGVATLHGDVRSLGEASVIEEAATAVSGVAGLVSHVHQRPAIELPDLEAGDESSQLQALLMAARAAGCTEPGDSAAVRTILTLFVEHLPLAQRTGLLIHLPPDVRRLAISPRRSGIAIGMLPNTIDALVDAVSQVIAVPHNTGHEVVVAVLQTLRAILPEEFRDIQGQLPHELADLWTVSPVPLKTHPGAD